MSICMENNEFTFPMLQQRAGNEGTPYILWREQDLFRARSHPVHIDFPGFFLCISGKLEIEINLRHYTIDTQKMLSFTTHYAVRIINRSEDFCCIGIIFSKTYWKQLFREYALGTLAVQNAIVPLTQQARYQLVQLHKLICDCTDTPQENNNSKAIHHLIVAFLALAESICSQYLADTIPLSRGEQLLFDFLQLLYKEYKSHRRVSYYAHQLSVTPRHLSTVIRQTSGRSASRWIEEYIALEARILLRNSPMTIKEIAYELHFNDQSLFSKYFSRVTGISPYTYRQQ